MEGNFKSLKNMYHILLLVLSMVLGGLLVNYRCVLCSYLNSSVVLQFVNATVGGYFILLCIVFVGICVAEELERITLIVAFFVAGIFYLVSTTFMIASYFVDGKEVRILVAAIFSALISVLFFAEAIALSCRKKSRPEE